MACYSPLQGYVGETGAIVFDPTKSPTREHIDVPCRMCIGCRIDYRREWAIRCQHEAQMHRDNIFLTLTYDQVHLPKDGNLDHRHFQKFIKSLRKRTGLKIRYMMCGEYGPKTLRPHYHAILFGYRPEDAYHWATRNGHKTWRSPTLEKAWWRGNSEFGSVTQQSAEYVAGYIHKKVIGTKADEHYTIVHQETGEILGRRTPEYSRMSNRPGIGKTWLEKYHTDVFPEDLVTVEGGKKFKVPKYYRDWLREHEPDLYESLRRKRVAHAKRSEDNTPERLATREKCAQARNKFKIKRDQQ